MIHKLDIINRSTRTANCVFITKFYFAEDTIGLRISGHLLLKHGDLGLGLYYKKINYVSPAETSWLN
jgi:hypothetical protein